MWELISQNWWIILLVGAMLFMHRPGGMHGGHGGHGGGGCCGGGHSEPPREKSAEGEPNLKKSADRAPSSGEKHSEHSH